MNTRAPSTHFSILLGWLAFIYLLLPQAYARTQWEFESTVCSPQMRLRLTETITQHLAPKLNDLDRRMPELYRHFCSEFPQNKCPVTLDDFREKMLLDLSEALYQSAADFARDKKVEHVLGIKGLEGMPPEKRTPEKFDKNVERQMQRVRDFIDDHLRSTQMDFINPQDHQELRSLRVWEGKDFDQPFTSPLTPTQALFYKHVNLWSQAQGNRRRERMLNFERAIDNERKRELDTMLDELRQTEAVDSSHILSRHGAQVSLDQMIRRGGVNTRPTVSAFDSDYQVALADRIAYQAQKDRPNSDNTVLIELDGHEMGTIVKRGNTSEKCVTLDDDGPTVCSPQTTVGKFVCAVFREGKRLTIYPADTRESCYGITHTVRCTPEEFIAADCR